VSFPLAEFEKAILSCLKEINPLDIIGHSDETKELAGLETEFKGMEAREAEVAREAAKGMIPSFGLMLREIHDEKERIGERLAAAREKAAHPLSDAWWECQTLIETLEWAANVEDTRLRLRNTIGRILESIWMLVVPKGRSRLCAVQLWFAGEDETAELRHPPSSAESERLCSHGGQDGVPVVRPGRRQGQVRPTQPEGRGRTGSRSDRNGTAVSVTSAGPSVWVRIRVCPHPVCTNRNSLVKLGGMGKGS
jgi:hypothetical protein